MCAHPFTMHTLKKQVDALLLRHMQTHPFWASMERDDPDGLKVLRSTVLAEGRRLRPLLFCTACRAAGCEPDPDFMPAALALELAHRFILAHDDLIDHSRMRRGTLSLPEQLRQQFEKQPAVGFDSDDYALVAGDLLLMLAMEPLLEVQAPDSLRTKAVALFLRAAMETGRGALLEMRAAQKAPGELTTEQIEMIYALKTGVYSFELPLRLAGLYSGSARTQTDTPTQIGRHAGIAFQLINDLSALQRWMNGGPVPDDVRDQRRTWALVHAGSVDTLRKPEVIQALEKTIASHAQRALELTTHPDVHALLSRALQMPPSIHSNPGDPAP